ncbi:hypothetical protein FE257_006044 [Aspergillus nanangensis]|uniref:Protein kinase domain-containing protein n=1 Tax=Aspergillus nanangensis TaxID=2582783 RepID=A0AAD4CPN4_ASPNN|nr:hypothetical protein FE257_006044 [Aspergillus nanangensis]
MEAVGLGFAAASVAELCLRIGKDLYKRCKSYLQAEHELREASLCIQGHWIKIEHQISVLHRVWKSLGDDLQIHQNLVLQVLQGKLQNAVNTVHSLGVLDDQRETSTLDRVVAKMGDTKRLKYAAYAKSCLEGIIVDLEKWQRRFDPSWFLLARIAVPVIDQQLLAEEEKTPGQSSVVSSVMQLRHVHNLNRNDAVASSVSTSIFLQASYGIQNRELIPLSTASTGSNSGHGLIIDYIPARAQVPINLATKDVRNLAHVLSNVDPERFGLLPCHGVAKRRDPSTQSISGFDIIFSIPEKLVHTRPRSLRSLLSTSPASVYPLNERVKLAVSLARSIVFLHSSCFVHKNISPENILLLHNNHQPTDVLGNLFLVGFERFRLAEGRTYMSGDSAWEKNLYRHPKRQGLHPEEEYTMQHDIYSVGVCLLEIGLWTTFVCYSEDPKSVTTPSPALRPIEGHIGARDQQRAATLIKDILVREALTRLPAVMGQIYSDVVVSCLTCLDKDNQRFGDEREFEDDDGILVGVRYIEKILFELEKIVV